MDALYRDYILDHYKRPRNFGTLEPHDLEHHDHNPLCGDEMGVHIRVEDGTHRRPALPRPGLRDLPGVGVDRQRGADRHAAWPTWPSSGPTGSSTCSGIDISPTRRKCALLSLKVMRGATTDDASWPE